MAVVGLLLGLGGSSGFAVMKAKKVAVATADSLAAKADSTAKNEHGDEGAKPAATAKARAPEPTEHASAPAAAPDSAAALHNAPPKADSTVAVVAADHGAPTKPAVTTPMPTAKTVEPAPGRIAKIFGAMAAKDAARVLQQMDDADVQIVLFGLNDRQAAAILAGFPPARAAAISRATFRKNGTS